MTVIVTGAAGFIGSHVAANYLRSGHKVVGVDNLSRPGNMDNLRYLEEARGDGEFDFHRLDIRNSSEMDRLFRANQDASLIVHEAGQVAVTTSVADPRTDFEINAGGTVNVLEAARKYIPGAIFLHASTNKVYGGMENLGIVESGGRYAYADRPFGVDEKEPLDFHSPYGCSKGAAEQYVRDYYRIYGLRTVVFRQSCIYGTRQYGMEDQGWVAWFTIAAIRNLPITIYGDGKQIRDLLWVDDLVRLYDQAVQQIDVAAGQIYNAGGGTGNTLSLLELVSLLETKLGKKIPVSSGDWRPGDQRVFVADSRKAQRELAWTPSTQPTDGVQKLVNWALAHAAEISEVLAPAAHRLCTGSSSR